jgi:hypothetical protein
MVGRLGVDGNLLLFHIGCREHIAAKLYHGDTADFFAELGGFVQRLRYEGQAVVYLVFDGRPYKPKAWTSQQRSASRKMYETKIADTVSANIPIDPSWYSGAFRVTEKLRTDCIKHLDSLGVSCIVAPYEADF